MQRDEAPIRTPCSADWDAMTGDEARRFCSLCDKHVHNLSAMTEADARGVVAQKDVCVRYTVNPRTQRIRHRAPRRFAIRAAAAATLTAGLALPAAAAISREPGEVGLLATVWQALVDWNADGDEVMTGGIELLPEEVVGQVPVTPEPVAAEPIPELSMMGDIAEPIEEVELGKVALPAVEP